MNINTYFGRYFGREMLHLARTVGHRRRPRGGELQAEPVQSPSGPKPLSGGAEAPLDFGV